MQTNLNKYKVLVTGAAGFIGSHVAECCLKLNMEVVAVDDLSGGFLANLPDGVIFVKADLRNDCDIEKIKLYGPFDFIYHLAAYAAEGLSHFIRSYNYENNLTASTKLLNMAINMEVKCFVFTSSIAVYGKNQIPMLESMVPQPEDPYGIAKYAFEMDLRAAHELFGLKYIIFRPHNVYGERQNIADKYRNVIGIFMNQILNNRAMTIFGDGSQTRAFSHINDVAPIISKSPLVDTAFCETYNIGADKPYSILELANKIAEAFGVQPHIKYLPERKEVLHAFSSHDKLFNAFNIKSTVTLDQGISSMANWVKTRGPMISKEFTNIEVMKNLPVSWQKNNT
jgi:UDP-glucose 4-epimerase